MKHVVVLLTLIGVLAGCHVRPTASDESVANLYYHPYGMPLTHAEWVRRGSSGRVVAHLKGGGIETIEYLEGARHGKAEWTFPYSEIVSRTCVYEKGHLIKECDHYPNGEPRMEVVYLPGSATRHVQVWYEEGAPQAQEHWEGSRLVEATYFFADGSVQTHVVQGLGSRIEWTGQYVGAKESYVDGWRILREELYREGGISSRLHYHQGQLEGLEERFNVSGQIFSSQEWVEGKREGLYTEYLHGEIINQVPYHSDVKDGVEKRYRRGELIETIDWVKGQRSGMHSLYVGGEVAKVEYYYKGSPVSKVTYEQLILH